jgi:hypothetical protein
MEYLEFVDEEKGIVVTGIPAFEEIVEKGVGNFLASPN